MAEKKYYGLYQGVVTNTKDPEKRGRIKVICPKVLGDKVESAWCDPLVNVAYDNGGDFCIPDKDEAVWLQFIEGDANKPVWLGGWWSKDKTPLGQNYSSADQVRILSYSDCIITMQNGAIEVRTGGGCSLKVENDKVYVSGNLEVNGDIKSTNKITANTLIVDSELSAGSVKSSGSVSANAITSNSSIKASTVSADSVSANSVEANGVSLSEHTHNYSGYSGTTQKPN